MGGEAFDERCPALRPRPASCSPRPRRSVPRPRPAWLWSRRRRMPGCGAGCDVCYLGVVLSEAPPVSAGETPVWPPPGRRTRRYVTDTDRKTAPVHFLPPAALRAPAAPVIPGCSRPRGRRWPPGAASSCQRWRRRGRLHVCFSCSPLFPNPFRERSFFLQTLSFQLFFDRIHPRFEGLNLAPTAVDGMRNRRRLGPTAEAPQAPPRGVYLASRRLRPA